MARVSTSTIPLGEKYERPNGMNRREQLFLLWALAATGLTVVLTGALVFLTLPRPPTRVSLGLADQFPPGSFTKVNLPLEFADPLATSRTAPQAWVVRDNAGAFMVFLARSTLGGVPVLWIPERDRFEDSYNRSAWDRTGKFVSGFDNRDLDRFPFSIENGELVIQLKLFLGASHDN